MYIYIYIPYIYICMCIYVGAYIHTYIYIYICVYICTCAYRPLENSWRLRAGLHGGGAEEQLEGLQLPLKPESKGSPRDFFPKKVLGPL